MPEAKKPEPQEVADVHGSHLVDLADGWKLWRTICMRGAGFPVSMLDSLAAPEAVAAIDRFIGCEAAYDEARRRALALCNRMLKESEGVTRKPLWRALRRISKGRVPDPLPDTPEMEPILDAFARARDKVSAARDEAETCVAEALSGISEALRKVGRDARFREAIAWQNRKALHEGVDVLLRTPAGKRNNQARKHERLIVNYLQRYCAKNESIGFFGPFAWGCWTDEGPPLTQRPGPDLIAARKVHFEYWAIDALVEVLSKDPRLRNWLCPRVNPKLRIEGNILIDELGNHKSMTPDAMSVLAACDGETAAAEVAASLVADSDCGLQTADHVYGILDRAAQLGVVSWTLDVPVGPHPERNLRKTLERVGDRALRSHLTAPLDKLEAARDAVAAAAGNADALDAALGELETLFIRLTGISPHQQPGKMYAGRSLVYEDCRRQTEINIGPEIRAQIGPPLALVLQSARWFSHTIAARFDDYLNRLYQELQARFAPQPVPVSAMEKVLFNRRNPVISGIVREVVEKLTARWASILTFEPGTRQLRLSTESLRAQVLAAFAAPCPGWSGARHHSPDILIVAEGPEDVRCGRFQCVLGEIHVTDSMVIKPLFQAIHPRPKDLIEAYQRDTDHAHVYRVMPRNFPGYRRIWDPHLAGDFRLAWDSSPTWRSRDGVLRISDLIVENSVDGLVVRTRDNARHFPAMVYFEGRLVVESFDKFRLLPRARHTPRITVNGLVISRESWRFPCRDLAFMYEKQETERFIGARCWAHSQGLPHWVFASFPQELKPVYVDLESPASVEVMAKLVRRASEVVGDNAELSLSEMLPDPAQLWLTDAQGNTYTSELRIVAVDPKSWRPPESASSRSA